MADLRDRFSWLDGVAVPDVWDRVERRGPQPPMNFPPSPSRRIAAIAVALIVIVLAGSLLTRAFRRESVPATPITEGAIVYATTTPDRTVVNALSPSGTAAIVPTGGLAESVWLREPTTSPDGSWIASAAVSRDDPAISSVALIDPTGGRVTSADAAEIVQATYFRPVGSPEWSPDGVSLAFDAVDEGVWIGPAFPGMREGVDVRSLVQVVEPEDARFGAVKVSAGEPTWSPADPAIAVSVAIDPAAPDAEPAQVWIVSTDEGGPVMRLTDEPLGAWDPDWSPDGQRIAFVTQGQVRLIPCDGSAPAASIVEGFDEVASPSWSPSGDAIVFAARDGGDWDLYVTDLDGQVTQLTDTSDVDELDPSWGPALSG